MHRFDTAARNARLGRAGNAAKKCFFERMAERVGLSPSAAELLKNVVKQGAFAMPGGCRDHLCVPLFVPTK
ncbi:hypothetical protein WDZ92_46025, partial [Nostoc sp. NIES-2111]